MPRPKSTQPTEKHLEILRTIIRLVQEGRAPVISELLQELGLAGASSLSRTLDVMKRLGLMEYIGGGARGKRKLLKVTESGRIAIKQLGIPLLGTIPAGLLEEALAHPEDRIDLPSVMAYEEGDFLLKVKGESMVGDGILNGDCVLVHPQAEAGHGEIAAVHIGEDFQVTLKRVFVDKERQMVTLRASNPEFADIVVKAEQVRIAGVYRGLFRTRSIYRGVNNYGT